MIRSCFVAALSDLSPKTVQLICKYTPESKEEHAPLPNASNLGSFCFPTGPENVKAREYMAPVEYSFTLTGADGSRLHGFCRSFLPPRTAPVPGARPSTSLSLRYPQVLCLISPHPFFTMYYKVLQILESILKQGELLTKLPWCTELPLSSPPAVFLEQFCRQCGPSPQPGQILRLELPAATTPLNVSPPRQLGRTPLASTDKFVEVEVPPDTGNGAGNAGIPFARLLWAVPVPQLLALLEALLLEKRVLLLGTEPDTVSAATHAAAALLYPFRWVHIFLPLLPHSLKDYLLAPMPFLIGLPGSHAVAGLSRIPLEEVVVVDLDLGTVRQGLNGPPVPPLHLPWADRLASALQMLYGMMRSPTEYESTPLAAELMQEYMLRLMYRYRHYIRPEESSSFTDEAGPDSPSLGRRSIPANADLLRAHGYLFDHGAFVASHKRNARAREFLEMFRHSQMYEQFVTQRLLWASTNTAPSEAFEEKVAAREERHSRQLGKQLLDASVKSANRFSLAFRKGKELVKAMRQGEGELGAMLRSGKGSPTSRCTSALTSSRSGQAQQPSPPSTSGTGAPGDPATWFSDVDDTDSDDEGFVGDVPFVVPARRSTQDTRGGPLAPPRPPRHASHTREQSGLSRGYPPQSSLPAAESQGGAHPSSSELDVPGPSGLPAVRPLLPIPSLMDADINPMWVATPLPASGERLLQDLGPPATGDPFAFLQAGLLPIGANAVSGNIDSTGVTLPLGTLGDYPGRTPAATGSQGPQLNGPRGAEASREAQSSQGSRDLGDGVHLVPEGPGRWAGDGGPAFPQMAPPGHVGGPGTTGPFSDLFTGGPQNNAAVLLPSQRARLLTGEARGAGDAPPDLRQGLPGEPGPNALREAARSRIPEAANTLERETDRWGAASSQTFFKDLGLCEATSVSGLDPFADLLVSVSAAVSRGLSKPLEGRPQIGEARQPLQGLQACPLPPNHNDTGAASGITAGGESCGAGRDEQEHRVSGLATEVTSWAAFDATPSRTSLPELDRSAMGEAAAWKSPGGEVRPSIVTSGALPAQASPGGRDGIPSRRSTLEWTEWAGPECTSDGKGQDTNSGTSTVNGIRSQVSLLDL
eukprot:jgi/Botrbrau1/23108/Bobra.0243s0042.1